MNKTIGKRKLTCIKGYKEILKMNIDKDGVLDRFIDEGMTLFGIQSKSSLIRKMSGSEMSQAEINGFNWLFKKFKIKINVWEEVE